MCGFSYLNSRKFAHLLWVLSRLIQSFVFDKVEKEKLVRILVGAHFRCAGLETHAGNQDYLSRIQGVNVAILVSHY
jgi:hypothetical protein